MRVLVGLLALEACVVSGQTAPRRLSIVDLLDSYAAGRFDSVVDHLAGDVDFGDLLEGLRRDGPPWIADGPPERRTQRELAAATFALEAARAGQWLEWKTVQKQPRMCGGLSGECYQPLSVLYWKAPALLVEWACTLVRLKEPRPIERWWQLAALAVAQRAEDPQFLIGDTNIGRGPGTEEIGNTADEIKHLDHVTPRFPKEMRFLLAQGIARDRVRQDEATRVYRALEKDPDVGGEAMMRFGAMLARQRRFDDALTSFDKAEALTRDPYVVYLARYFKAQVLEQQRRPADAEAAYRGAAAAIPNAQSATIALSTILFREGRRDDGYRLIENMLAARPAPRDPWRSFVHADDRFWPQLVGRLRSEIVR